MQPLTPQVETPQVNPVSVGFWASNILIVGASGSGKSSSFRNLPKDKSTGLLLTEPKMLPFANTFTNVEINEDFKTFITQLNKLKSDPQVKRIVIDSLSKHLERCLNHCRTNYKNYDIWTAYGKLGFEVLNNLSDKRVVIIAISIDESVEQEVVDITVNNPVANQAGGNLITVYKKMAATNMGTELRGKIEKEFAIVAHSQVKREAGKNEFIFQIKPTPTTTAKSPMDMFPNKETIPNDVNLILKEIEDKLKYPCF